MKEKHFDEELEELLKRIKQLKQKAEGYLAHKTSKKQQPRLTK